jgi:hypothetical protein
VATGTGEARTALMIWRIEVSRPPGVFMRRMTSRISLGFAEPNWRTM